MGSAWLYLPLISLALGLGTGCTNAKIEEVHHFAAYGPSGETNFYRVKVTGVSHNAVSSYSSGQFPSEAVDAVFGEADPSQSPDAERKALRRAVHTAAERYARVIGVESADAAAIQEALDRYQGAVAQLAALLSRDEVERVELPTKLVFVLSADPSRVIQAIKDETDIDGVAQTLASLFQSEILGDAIVLRERFRQQDSLWAAWRAEVSRIDDALQGEIEAEANAAALAVQSERWATALESMRLPPDH